MANETVSSNFIKNIIINKIKLDFSILLSDFNK